jgi:hypothetical protein
MKKPVRLTLFWAPRILGILFAIFISLFALDIFDLQLGFWETLLGLFMHLIPTFLIVIALMLAWRWEWVGALFLGIGAYFILRFSDGWDWLAYLLLVTPLFLIGVLFLVGWFYRAKIHPVG